MPKALAMSSLESLWHKRLGHRNYTDIKKLSKLNVGVPEDLEPIGKCEPCEVSKHTQRSFPKSREWKSTVPMEIVHTVLYGPVDEESLGGSKYAIVFTDEATNWRIGYYMNSKGEVLSKLKQFVADVSRQMDGVKVKRIHSDNAKEFISNDRKAFCGGRYKVYDQWKNYAPQQNGKAERSWRTIGEMATCLLEDAGLGKDLWAEAMNYAVYIVNRAPSAVVDGKTPYSTLFGKQADLSHLRVFGCPAYVQKSKNRQKKMHWRKVISSPCLNLTND